MNSMAQPKDDTIARAFDAHAPALLLYARQWAASSAADDILQSVFLKLIAGRHLPTDFRTWLFRCVRNEAISASRSTRRRDRREKANAVGALFVPQPEAALDVQDAQQALLSLPLQLREVVTLRIWSDLTFAEISAVTGTALSTVYDRYKAGLAELRQNLETPCTTR